MMSPNNLKRASSMHHQGIGSSLPIWSPIPKGSGALVVHRFLQKTIPDYCLRTYHPYQEVFPLTLLGLNVPPETRVIHTTPDYGYFFARHSAKLVLTFHNYVLDAFMRPYSTWFQKIHYLTDLKWWTRMGVQKAHILTAVSQFTADVAKQNLRLKKPVHVIYNGIDTNLFRPPRHRKKPQRRLRVFFSGNLSRRKGSQWLASISKRISGRAEIFYTSGLRHRGYIPQTGNLTCLGSVRHEKMPELYRSMDILLLPTVREGFSMAVLEAMASGLPVVASDCSSLPEQIDHGQGGFLCSIGDCRTFAQYIRHLATNRDLCVAMGQYNRARIEARFTLNHMVRAYVDLFKQIRDGH
jgi:glycosyltransferase involved in cell wall biosynthesis